MRDIKFRAWDGRVMVDVYMVDHFGEQWKVNDDIDSTMDKWPIMQYTGLKDKNGKEIYEGDIIISKGYIEAPYVVTWHKIGFGVRYIKNEEAIFITDSAWQAIEVIGNIYQNPELIQTPAPV